MIGVAVAATVVVVVVVVVVVIVIAAAAVARKLASEYLWVSPLTMGITAGRPRRRTRAVGFPTTRRGEHCGYVPKSLASESHFEGWGGHHFTHVRGTQRIGRGTVQSLGSPLPESSLVPKVATLTVALCLLRESKCYWWLTGHGLLMDN